MSTLTTTLTIADLKTLRDKVFEKHLTLPGDKREEKGKATIHILSYTETQLALCQWTLAEEFRASGKNSWNPEDRLPPRAKEIYTNLLIWLVDEEYQLGLLFSTS